MKRRTFKQVSRRQTLQSLLGGVSAAALAAGLSAPTWAGPRGEQVVSGSANFTRDGNRTVIEAANNTIINYQSFDVGRHETVQFIQPNEAARVLNRILGGGRTSIEGSLLANGHVYFVNPAGIFLGGEAVVNVGALTAAAGSISNADFLSGIDRFTSLSGSVINAGQIHASSGVHLFGHQVVNLGSIVTGPGGVVTLAAGDQVLLAQAGTGVLVDVKGGTDLDGAAVRNVGLIETAYGQVSLSAADAYSLAVEHSGTIRAADVQLMGLDGQVSITGWVDASNDAGTGGRIQAVGREVALVGAELDASGRDGGGSIYVGGDVGGRGTMPTATYTLVDDQSVLNARATGLGDGGTIVVWADQGTIYYGSLSVAGGLLGGNGGFAEVSGAFLNARGNYDLSAVAGQAGTLLFDPIDVVIRGGIGDGSDNGGSVSGLDPQQINWNDFVNTSPFVIYQSELQGVTGGTIIVEASRSIVTQGAFGGNAVVLAEDVNLILRTTNHTPGTDGSFQGIDLTAHGSAPLAFRTTGLGSIEILAASSGVTDLFADPVEVRISSLQTADASLVIRNQSGSVVIRDQVEARGGASGDINIESATDTILMPGASVRAGDELIMVVGSPEITRQVVPAGTVLSAGTVLQVPVALADGTVLVRGTVLSEDLVLPAPMVLGEGALDFTDATIHARRVGNVLVEGDITVGLVTGHYFNITSKRGRILDGDSPGANDGVDISVTGWVDLSAGIAIGQISDGNSETNPGTNGSPLTGDVDVDWDFVSTEGNALEIYAGGTVTDQSMVNDMPRQTYFGSARIHWIEDSGQSETAPAIPADTGIHLAFVNQDNTGYLDLSRGYEYVARAPITVNTDPSSGNLDMISETLGKIYGSDTRRIVNTLANGDVITLYDRRATSNSGFFNVDLTQVDGGRAILRAGNIDASRSYDVMSGTDFFGSGFNVARYHPETGTERIDPRTVAYDSDGNPIAGSGTEYSARPLATALRQYSDDTASGGEGDTGLRVPQVTFGTINYSFTQGFSNPYVINADLEVDFAGGTRNWVRGDLTYDYLSIPQNGLVNGGFWDDPPAFFSIDGNDSIGLIAEGKLVIPNIGVRDSDYQGISDFLNRDSIFVINPASPLNEWMDYWGDTYQVPLQDLILHGRQDILQRHAFWDAFFQGDNHSISDAAALRGLYGGAGGLGTPAVVLQVNPYWGDILAGFSPGDNQNQLFGNFDHGTEIQARHLSFRTGNESPPTHTPINPTIPGNALGRIHLNTDVDSLDIEFYGTRDVGTIHIREKDSLLVTRLIAPDGNPGTNVSGQAYLNLEGPGDVTILSANLGGSFGVGNLDSVQGDVTVWFASAENFNIDATGSVFLGDMHLHADGETRKSFNVTAGGDIRLVDLYIDSGGTAASALVRLEAQGMASGRLGDVTVDRIHFGSYDGRNALEIDAAGDLLFGELNLRGLPGPIGVGALAISNLLDPNLGGSLLSRAELQAGGNIGQLTDAQVQADFHQMADHFDALGAMLPDSYVLMNAANAGATPNFSELAEVVRSRIPEPFAQRLTADILEMLDAGGSIDIRTQIALLDGFEFTANTRIDEADGLYIRNTSSTGGNLEMKVGGDLWIQTLQMSGDILLAAQNGGDIVFMGLQGNPGDRHITTTGNVTLLAGGRVSGVIEPNGTVKAPAGAIEANDLAVVAGHDVRLRTILTGDLAIHSEGHQGIWIENTGGALSLGGISLPVGDDYIGGAEVLAALYPGLGEAFDGTLQGIRSAGGDLYLSADGIVGVVIGLYDPEQRGNVTLIATAGDVILSDTVLAEALVIQAANVVNVATDVDSLDVTAGGNVTVTEVDGLALNVNTTGNVLVTVQQGDLLLGRVNAGAGNVNLAATQGSILDNNGPAVNIIGNRLDLRAAHAIGTIEDLRQFTGDAIETQVAQIGDVVTTAAGSTINLMDSSGNPLNFVGQVRPGDGVAGSLLIASDTDLDARGLFGANPHVVLDSGDSIGFASGGVLTVDSVINLGANSGTTLLLWGADDVVGASGRTLQLEATHIQFASGADGGDTTLNVTAQTLAAGLTGAGDLTVSATDDLTVAAATHNGDLTLASTGKLTLEDVMAGQHGDISLAASGGIDGSGRVTGGALSVTAGDQVALQTQVERLDAQITGGGITVQEANDLAVGQVVASGDVRIAVGGNLRGTSQDGVADVVGQRVSLAATGTVAGATDAQAFEVTANDRLDASGNQRVRVNMIGGSGRVGLVQASRAGGRVELHSDGNLLGSADDNVADITAAHIALVAAGRIGGPTPGSALDVLVPVSFSADTSAAPGGADRSVTIDFLAGRPGQVNVTGGGVFTESVLASELATALPVVANQPTLDVPLFVGDSDDELAGGGAMADTTRTLGRREQVGGVPVATFVAAVDRTAMGYQQYVVAVRFEQYRFSASGFVRFLQHGFAGENRSQVAARNLTLSGLQDLNRDLQVQGLLAPGRTVERHAAIRPFVPQGWSVDQLDAVLAEVRSSRGLGAMASLR